MELNTIHIVSMVASFALALIVSVRSGKNVKSSEQYNVGGRAGSVLMVSGAFCGLVIGGGATVGTAQMAFSQGISAWWFTIGCGVGLFVLGCIYSRGLRKDKLSTIPEVLAKNFGPISRPIASIISISGTFFAVVTSLLTATHLFLTIFDMPAIVAILLSMISALMLVYIGGIGGSGSAGFLKMILLSGTILVSGILVWQELGSQGGMPVIFSEKMLDITGGDLGTVIMSLINMTVGVVVSQAYVQAVFSARTNEVALVSTFIAGCASIIIGCAATLIGMYMKVAHPEIRPVSALLTYMLLYLPDWLAGLGITALLLSSLGAVSGLLLAISTMMANDIYAPLFKISHDFKIMRANKRFMVATIITASIVSYSALESMVLSWSYISTGVRGGGLFFAFSAAVLFSGSIKKEYGIAAMISGAGCFLLLNTFAPWKISAFSSLLISLLICLMGRRNTVK